MNIRALFSLSIASLLALAAASTSTSTPAYSQGKIRVVVSVDWEGDDLIESNLVSIRDFRQDYPTIPMQHFLNAAYFTKAGANPSQTSALMHSVLLPIDEEGLHIHAWRSLVQASGVTFRTGPSFVAEAVDLRNCLADCGNDVMLTAYSESELRKIIKFSLDTLEKQGFDRARSFRAGGWIANRKVLRALAAEGITLDSSATYSEYLKEQWGNYNLYPIVGRLWPSIQPTSQPFVVALTSDTSILELPNNGNLADYMTGDQMFKAFLKNVELLKVNSGRDVYLSIGFHQETAATYLPHLRSGIDQIRAYAEQNLIPIEFVVAPL